jgi:hypothetical protein
MTETMRTTLTIDLDMLQTARERAEARSETLGKVVSDMMREGLATKDRSPEYRNGIKLLPSRDFTRKGSVEVVNELLDESERF